jgi:polyhydroxyalkanoate synthesis regulator phasin
LGEDYAARVDGLLREVHASLQKISERMETGELTPEQARELKLAATRDMISRLDTISAVYDARLDSKNKICTDTESGAGNASAASSAGHAGTGTVSVEELKREMAGAAAVPSAEGLLDECD